MIELAREAGFLGELEWKYWIYGLRRTPWLLREAGQGFRPFSFNITPDTLKDKDFLDSCKEIARRNAADPHNLMDRGDRAGGPFGYAGACANDGPVAPGVIGSPSMISEWDIRRCFIAKQPVRSSKARWFDCYGYAAKQALLRYQLVYRLSGGSRFISQCWRNMWRHLSSVKSCLNWVAMNSGIPVQQAASAG